MPGPCWAELLALLVLLTWTGGTNKACANKTGGMVFQP